MTRSFREPVIVPAIPASLIEAEGTDVHDFGMPHRTMRLPVARRVHPCVGLFVRPPGPPPTNDLKLYDVGLIYVAFDGCNSTGSPRKLGTLRVRGIVRLYNRYLAPTTFPGSNSTQIVGAASTPVSLVAGTGATLTWAPTEFGPSLIPSSGFNTIGLCFVDSNSDIVFFNAGLYEVSVHCCLTCSSGSFNNATGSLFLQVDQAAFSGSPARSYSVLFYQYVQTGGTLADYVGDQPLALPAGSKISWQVTAGFTGTCLANVNNVTGSGTLSSLCLVRRLD